MDKDENKDNKNEGEKDMESVIKRYCSVSESLEESLKEMKLMREGKLPKRNLDSFLKLLEEEIKQGGK